MTAVTALNNDSALARKRYRTGMLLGLIGVSAFGLTLPIGMDVLGLLTGLIQAYIFAILATVYLPGIGHSANGSARWVRIGGQSVQPSELVKWGMIALIAWYGSHGDFPMVVLFCILAVLGVFFALRAEE